ncbi:MAG: hypothetical protein NT126_05820 [Bacteroidetes bacterium]|nr:hypothetical protein [Bacteroidota bacterium]
MHLHTALKPLLAAELRKTIPLDSIQSPIVKDGKFNRTWTGRKLRREHLLSIDKDDLKLSVDPVFNFQVGRDNVEKKNVYVNTKGLLIQGTVNDQFYFYTGFHENQANYVNYVDAVINVDSVVPGQGKTKFLENGKGYDFSQSYGGIGYVANRHFDFQLATDKLFIGEGYRSLLLSDNSYNFPFLKINATFWKFRYTVIYAVMQDLIPGRNEDVGYQKKYATFHYLDVNIGKREKLSAGLFEAVIWKHDPSRGFELNYLNPVLFLRPVENSLNSPDNELLGFNLKYRLNPKNILYGQLMLDEFLLHEVIKGNGWWGNKQAFQLGYKSFHLFGVKNLNMQSEFNFVRPYTYSHRTTGQNYAQYNEALAHPMGANFYESVSFVNYRWKNFFVEVKYLYTQKGIDFMNSNDGGNIFLSYDTHPFEYGNKLLQGVLTTTTYKDISFSYLVNPVTNFRIEAGVSDRNYKNNFSNVHTEFFYFGIRTALENYYFDF